MCILHWWKVVAFVREKNWEQCCRFFLHALNHILTPYSVEKSHFNKLTQHEKYPKYHSYWWPCIHHESENFTSLKQTSSMPVRSDFFEKEASAFNKKNSELFWTVSNLYRWKNRCFNKKKMKISRNSWHFEIFTCLDSALISFPKNFTSILVFYEAKVTWNKWLVLLSFLVNVN